MMLGKISSNCVRCEAIEGVEWGLIDGFLHDLRCWGIRTALYNVWYRLIHGEDE